MRDRGTVTRAALVVAAAAAAGTAAVLLRRRRAAAPGFDIDTAVGEGVAAAHPVARENSPPEWIAVAPAVDAEANGDLDPTSGAAAATSA